MSARCFLQKKRRKRYDACKKPGKRSCNERSVSEALQKEPEAIHGLLSWGPRKNLRSKILWGSEEQQNERAMFFAKKNVASDMTLATSWCARLDSNQRPSGSEFPDTQRQTAL